MCAYIKNTQIWGDFKNKKWLNVRLTKKIMQVFA